MTEEQAMTVAQIIQYLNMAEDAVTKEDFEVAEYLIDGAKLMVSRVNKMVKIESELNGTMADTPSE